MTEASYPWAGTVVGDAGGYDHTEWAEAWRNLFGGNASKGISPYYGNKLKVTGSSSPVSIDTGAALVHGTYYKNDSSVNVVIPTPGTWPRKDLIVLRKDHVAQTIRITRIAGAETDATPDAPSITQNDTTFWDARLAEVEIDTLGNITITEEREILHSGRVIGEVTMYVGSTAPDRWIFGYGQELSRTTYSHFFGLVGTSFGVGDGSTTFNAPDLRGRFLLGKDDMGGVGANRVTDAGADSIGSSGSGGAETHTLTAAEIPAGLSIDISVIKDPKSGSGPITVDSATSTATTDTITGAGTGGGSGGAHDNMPPWITLNAIIYVGV